MIDKTHPLIPRRDEGPPADGATLVPSSPSPQEETNAAVGEQTLAGLPSDVTLNPTDPQSQAFHQAAIAAAPSAGPAGQAFGHYDLLEPIAKGGMGIVYKALQRKLNRIVAIKMILDGQFADQTDIDRFYAEAEAAAALSHPNIVAIHEIGHAEGQHYFSMDYIEGQSLAALVRENPLHPRRAAEFVSTIAEAVQFAHDHGVVHRDLKPANILLDKRMRPLITDFGLAKQVGSQSQRTLAGSVVGTPSYMPPEQAAGKTDEIGPWSDLYSLGAILYELLTGRPPFRSASPFETIRQVLDTEPVSPRLLNPQVPRDLETICLKCLQKERARRYATVQELADELGRYLRGEPIQARPISQVARLWRLCKRNPITSSAIAVAAAFFVAASLVSTVAYVRTKESLRRETAALVQSEQSFHDAMDAVNDLFTTVSENTLLNQPGMQPLREVLLKKPLDYYQRFLQQRGDDPTVQDELAAALYRVGQITEVLQSADEALPSYESARQVQVRQLAAQPDDPRRLEALGNTLNALGTLWVKKKDFAKARVEYDESARVRRELAAAQPGNSEYQRALANTYMNVGMAEYKRGQLGPAREQFDEAQRIRLTALKDAPQHARLRRDLAKAYYNLGFIDHAQQDDAAAEQHFQQAVDLLEQLTAAPPPELDNLENEKLLAVCYQTLGDILSDERAAQRRAFYEKALGRLEPLAAQNPAVPEYQRERGALYMNLAELEMGAGNLAAARGALERARDIFQPLAERYHDESWYQRDLAVTLRELAKVLDAAGEPQAAAASLDRAIKLLSALVEQKPQEAEYAEALRATREVVLGGSAKRN